MNPSHPPHLTPHQIAVHLKLDQWLMDGSVLDGRKARHTSLLHDAAYVGHVGAAKALLQNPHVRVLQERAYPPYIRSVAATSPQLNPTVHPVMPIHVATYYAPPDNGNDGQTDSFLSVLLKHPQTDVNRGPIQPILIACFQGNLSVVKQLIRHGSDMESSIYRSVSGRYKFDTSETKKWCYQKCGITQPNMESIHHTPLMIATAQNNVALVDYLLTMGAELKTDNHRLDNHHMETPLMIAAYKGHGRCIDLLLKACRSRAVQLPTSHACDAQFVTQYVNQPCLVNGTITTPLIQAAQEGHADVVKQLLAAGASIDKPRSDGVTALRIALEMKHESVAAVLRQ